jgi:hypothetical protein
VTDTFVRFDAAFLIEFEIGALSVVLDLASHVGKKEENIMGE